MFFLIKCMWSFKQWLYEYRDPKYEPMVKEVMSIIQVDLDKVASGKLTAKDLKDMFQKHNINVKYSSTIPIILTMRTGDVTHVHALPSKEIEDAVCSTVIKWWNAIRKSKYTFSNKFIMVKALEANGNVELAAAHQVHVPKYSEMDVKWKAHNF